jgi:PIN domain nuclease of toxin-antitoxin system
VEPDHTLFVSSITALELSRLISLSRLNLRKPLSEWWAAARQNLRFEEVAMHPAMAIATYELPGDFHKVPTGFML